MLHPTDDALESVLRELFRGLDERGRLPDGPERQTLDVRLGSLLDRLRRVWHSPRAATLYGEDPPRAVAVALAQAIFSQPHLSGTLDPADDPLDDPRAPDPPLLVPAEVLSDVLKLPDWELDDIRDEIDQRAVRCLKQQLAVDWLWGNLGRDDRDTTLWRMLFPGIDPPGEVSFVRRGCVLYARVDQPALARAALYLGWLGEVRPGTVPPIGGFSARYIEESLRRGLARGIGVTEDEADALLERMVVVVPAEDWQRYATHDQWRSGGAAALTFLSPSFADSAWLTRPLRAADVHFQSFLDPDRPDPDVLTAAFDAMAGRRTAAAARQIYAELLARQSSGGDLQLPSGVDDIELFDVRLHLSRSLEPLLDWANAPTTAAEIGRRLEVEPAVAAEALDTMVEVWQERADTRWRTSDTEEHGSVQASLTMHLVSLHASLRQLLTRPALRIGPHRDVLLLFAAHYLASAPVELLWADRSGDSWPPSEDPFGNVVGPWFWALWKSIEGRLSML